MNFRYCGLTFVIIIEIKINVTNGFSTKENLVFIGDFGNFLRAGSGFYLWPAGAEKTTNEIQ